jgi:hypothetical protein
MQVQLEEGLLRGIRSQFLVEGDEGETLDETSAVLPDESFVREHSGGTMLMGFERHGRLVTAEFD